MYATAANKKKALTCIKTFATLINFHGGWGTFAPVHNKLAGFITAPQLSPVCLKPEGEYNRRRLLLMPRGHLKSTVCSVLYSLWRIYRNPNIRILVGTNNLQLAEAFVREIRQYLEDEELQTRVWNARPHISGRLVPVMDTAAKKRRKQQDDDETEAEDKKVLWTAKAIQVLRPEPLKEPTVLAASVGTRATGSHYDLLILDDIVDFDNSSTEAKIKKVFEWTQDLESIIDPPKEVQISKGFSEVIGDEFVVLGTVYDALDYYHYIMQNKKDLEYKVFSRNIYINGVDDAKGYIWKSRFTPKYVARLRARTTPKRWASQYLNTIIAEGENLLDPGKIRYFKSDRVEKHDNGTCTVSLGGDQGKRVIKLFLVVDPAISQKSTADNTVLSVGGTDEHRDVFIVDTRIGKFTPAQTVDHIYELCDKWNLHSVTLETNGVGAGLPYALRERFRSRRALVIREHKQTVNKKEKLEARLQPLFQNEKLWLADWMAANAVIQGEVTMFPRETAKDDFLDTVDMVCEVSYPTPNKMNKTLTPRRQFNKKWGGVR